MAQKAGITDKVNEKEILSAIGKRLAPRFHDIICQQVSDQKRKPTKKAVLPRL